MASIGDESMSCPKYSAPDQVGSPGSPDQVASQTSGEGSGTGAFYKLYPDLEKPVVKTSNRTGCWVRGNFFTFPKAISSSASTLKCTVEGMLWHFKAGLPECLGCFLVGNQFLANQAIYMLKTGKECTCNCNQRMDRECQAALLEEGLVEKEGSHVESIMDDRTNIRENFNSAKSSKEITVNSDDANSKEKFHENISEAANLKGNTTGKNVEGNSNLRNENFDSRRIVDEEGDELPRLNRKTGCSVAGTFYTFPFSTSGSFCRCTEHGMLWCWKGGIPSCLGCLVDGLHFSPSSSYKVASGTICTCTCSQRMDKECHHGPLHRRPWKGMAWHIE